MKQLRLEVNSLTQDFKDQFKVVGDTNKETLVVNVATNAAVASRSNKSIIVNNNSQGYVARQQLPNVVIDTSRPAIVANYSPTSAVGLASYSTVTTDVSEPIIRLEQPIVDVEGRAPISDIQGDTADLSKVATVEFDEATLEIDAFKYPVIIMMTPFHAKEGGSDKLFTYEAVSAMAESHLFDNLGISDEIFLGYGKGFEDWIGFIEVVSSTAKPVTIDVLGLDETLSSGQGKGLIEDVRVLESGKLYLQDYFLENFYKFQEEYTSILDYEWPGSHDYLGISEIFNLVLTRPFYEEFSISEAISVRPNKLFLDSTSFYENYRFTIDRNELELIQLSEIVDISAAVPITEDLPLEETLGVSFNRAPADDFSFIREEYRYLFRKPLSDDISITESLSLSSSLYADDSFELSESLLFASKPVVIDSATMLDMISLDSDKAITEGLSLSDSISIAAARPAALDVFGISEEFKVVPNKGRLELVSFLEYIGFFISPDFEDQYNILEEISARPGLPFSDDFGFIESSTFSFNRVFFDFMPMSEELRISSSRSYDEDLVLGEDVTIRPNVASLDLIGFTEASVFYVRSFTAESLSLVETITKTSTTSFSDISSVFEEIRLRPNKLNTDTLSLSEDYWIAAKSVISELTSLSEALQFNTSAKIAEILTMNEVLSLAVSYKATTDTFSMPEQLSLKPMVPVSETTNVAEVISSITRIAVSDSINFFDFAYAKDNTQDLTSLTDILNIRPRPIFSDNFAMSESYFSSVRHTITDVVSLNEVWSKVINSKNSESITMNESHIVNKQDYFSQEYVVYRGNFSTNFYWIT